MLMKPHRRKNPLTELRKTKTCGAANFSALAVTLSEKTDGTKTKVCLGRMVINATINLTMVRQVNEEKRELMIPDIATNQ